MKRLTSLLLACLVLTACGETQRAAGARKVDDASWQATDAAYVANGFKAGDKAAWEQQLKARNQGQNEYTRTSAR